MSQVIDFPLEQINSQFAGLTAVERAQWALKNLPGTHILSSSFGIQAAVCLHLLSQLKADIPVVLVDTGYLFPETYQFIDQLQDRLQLNLKVYRAPVSPAWQEARYGKLWQQGEEGIQRYNRINKVKPMEHALGELQVGTWFAGLRREQAKSRDKIQFVEQKQERYKVHPIADWSNRDVWNYLKQYDLPYHPLWEKGYASVGDVHTTRPLEDGMSEEETRFFGLQRECGLHTEL